MGQHSFSVTPAEDDGEGPGALGADLAAEAMAAATRETVGLVFMVAGTALFLGVQKYMTDPAAVTRARMRACRTRQLAAAWGAHLLHALADDLATVAARSRTAYYKAAGQ